MDIRITDFSAVQRQALFDLLILAMYADGHLTNVEDEQLKQLLAAMGNSEEFDREREFDAAVTRLRPFLQSRDQTKSQVLLLADTFTDRNQQKQAYDAVVHLMTGDGHITSWESTLLSELRLKFRL